MKYSASYNPLNSIRVVHADFMLLSGSEFAYIELVFSATNLHYQTSGSGKLCLQYCFVVHIFISTLPYHSSAIFKGYLPDF